MTHFLFLINGYTILDGNNKLRKDVLALIRCVSGDDETKSARNWIS